MSAPSTGATAPIDAERLTLVLNELRLPAIKANWPGMAQRADKEGWPAARFLTALAEHEVAERGRRRIERHLGEARLPPGKTLDGFAFDATPMISRAQVMAMCAGDGWLDKGANLILFGPPGGGKSHLAAAIGLALVENGWRVLFTRTSDLVQKLQVARRELGLEAALARLDKYHLLILDDLAYVTKDQAETSVLFELISARYERRSTLITANQPFGEWGKVFPEPSFAGCREAGRAGHSCDDYRSRSPALRADACRRCSGIGLWCKLADAEAARWPASQCPPRRHRSRPASFRLEIASACLGTRSAASRRARRSVIAAPRRGEPQWAEC